ncbi:hypothetical protein Tco_1226151 [Tanacetum coccineum]
MDKSWMETNRTNKSYIDGVAAFIDYAIHNLQKMSNIDPLEHKVEEVQFHLFKNGIDLSYIKWSKHREKDEPSISAPKSVNATTEFVDDTNFASNIPTDGPATVEMVNATKDNFDEEDLVKFQELLLDAEKPLYEGCPDFTKLSAIVKLLNLKGKYGCSDKFFTKLLGLLKKMLHVGKEMVEKTYQAKKVMKLMGSGYKKIHVCINNCLLYWKDDTDLTACLTCRISRWKVDNKTHKVYENIPAKAWHTIDEKFPKIAEDPRNLRLGISVNGVDVNRGNRHHRNDIDVFLELLVDDLHTLFETGVDTYDASTKDNFMYWRHNSVPHCIDFMYVEKNVAESLVGTLLNVLGKTKDGVNARLDLAELGVKPELFAMQEEDKTTLPPAGYTLTNAEKDIFCETLYNIRKAHLYVIQNTDEIVQYIERHKQVLKTKNPGKRIAFLENEHSKSFAKWLRKEVERELAISKESVSEIVRWISYGPRTTVVKYDAYNINGYTFRTKCHDGKFYQNSGVSVEAIDLHISKEVATTRQTFYYGVLQEIWVLDYRFRQIPLFKCDWVNHRAGGVKRDNLGYTLVDLNNLGHKVDPFILASQARQVFYVKDQIDKKLSIVFKTPPKNYKDTYDEVDEEFSTVIHQHNDNILPHVDRHDLGNQSRNDFYRTDCGGLVIRKSK